MRRITIPILLLLMLSFAGCLSTTLIPTIAEPQTQPPTDQECDIAVEAMAAAEAAAPLPFTVLYAGADIEKAMYEPAVGAYLGIWLWDGLRKQDINAMAEREHAVFAIEMTLGDEFPSTWILQSISARAAPLIVLRMPESAAEDFPLHEITMFAHELGQYNLPAFVVFNPLPSVPGISAEDYVLLFRYARILFRTYAPMAAFVWHGDDINATPKCPFYPGHDAVDWVSVALTAPQGPEGFVYDIPSKLKPFYLSFQQYKPIIILPIGVSHFSHRDFVYRVPQAAAEIVRVYEAIRDGFPRVRMVVYANHGLTSARGDDFSITREQGTMEAYRDAIADSHFISRLMPRGDDGPLWLLSPLNGYYHEGQVFVDQEVLPAGHRRVSSNAIAEINGRSFVEIGAVQEMEIDIDHTRRVIWITG